MYIETLETHETDETDVLMKGAHTLVLQMEVGVPLRTLSKPKVGAMID